MSKGPIGMGEQSEGNAKNLKPNSIASSVPVTMPG
jgi:hypothetical protein